LRLPFGHGIVQLIPSTDQLNPAREVSTGAQSKTTAGGEILCFACGCEGGETTQRIRRKPPLQNQSIFSDKEMRVASSEKKATPFYIIFYFYIYRSCHC